VITNTETVTTKTTFGTPCIIDVKNVFTFFILVTFFTFLTFFYFPYVFSKTKNV